MAVDIEAGCPPPRDPHTLFDRQNALDGNLPIKDGSLAMQQEPIDWRYLPYIRPYIVQYLHFEDTRTGKRTYITNWKDPPFFNG